MNLKRYLMLKSPMSGLHIPFEKRAIRTATAFGINPEFDMLIDPSTGRASFKQNTKFREYGAEAKSIHPEPFDLDAYCDSIVFESDDIPF